MFTLNELMTTLEQAAEYGHFTQAGATAWLEEHGLTWDEAFKELGDNATDAMVLCQWMGY